jgi:hypothetical protein
MRTAALPESRMFELRRAIFPEALFPSYAGQKSYAKW